MNPLRRVLANWDGPPPGFLEGSVHKDLLYHGTRARLSTGFSLRPDVTGQGHEGEYGIYLTPRRRDATIFGPHTLEVLASIHKPLIVEEKFEIVGGLLTRADIQAVERRGFDSIVVTSSTIARAYEVILFHPDQAWVCKGSAITGATQERIDESERKEQGGYEKAGGPTMVVGGVTFRLQRHPDQVGHVLVRANVAKLDNMSKRMAPDFHVGSGGEGGISGRYPRFEQFFARHPHGPIKASYIHLEPASDGRLLARFCWVDGRHRFAVMRDQGVEWIAVQIEANQAGLVKRLLQ